MTIPTCAAFAPNAGITTPDLITRELARLKACGLRMQVDHAATLWHYEQQVRQLAVEQFVAVRDLDRSEDGLVLENYGAGHAWLRPR